MIEKPSTPMPVIRRFSARPPVLQPLNAWLHLIRPRKPVVAVSETYSHPCARAISSTTPSMTVLPKPRAPVKRVSKSGARTDLQTVGELVQ